MKSIQQGYGIVAVLASACTQQLPDSFRFQQQNELFASSQYVNTKVDMLWVVDNTPSMWPSQKKIREGFQTFANQYMKPNWDIRVAVISQDTYLAHPAFADFLNSVAGTGSAQRYSRSNGYQSTYLDPNSGANPKRTTAFVEPLWWGSTAISANGTVGTGGIKLRQGVMDYGGANLTQDVGPANPSQYARLIPGRHDGPLATICWTSNSNPFFFGISQCHVRDQENIYTGVDDCVAGGNGIMDSTVQCNNTLMNNTVRSGKPIISTQPPSGTAGNQAWTDQLYKDFIVNFSGGVSGYPMEKFFNSIQQLISDNEAAGSDTKLFRAGALRIIVFVTDEDDQSTVFPTGQITPDSQYNPNGSCPWKTVDNHTYRLQICPKPAEMLSVAGFKAELDQFFRTLDGDPTGDPNYFAITITPMTGQTIKDLHDDMGESGGGYNSVSSDYATRLSEFLDLVGNGSLKFEISSTDYSPILDTIGQAVVSKKAIFTLNHVATGEEDMLVWVLHANGTKTLIDYDQFDVNGNTLTITDLDFMLSLAATDQILINYQPLSSP